MIKKAFFGSTKPRLEYTVLPPSKAMPEHIRPSEKVVFHLRKSQEPTAKILLEKGDRVRIGQKILPEKNGDFCLSPCTGSISDITSYTGMLGEDFHRISIAMDADQKTREPAYIDNCRKLTLENGQDFFSNLPGKPDFSPFSNPDTPVQTIAVLGIDDELLCTTNQFFIRNHPQELRKGINLLGKLTGISDIIIYTPEALGKNAQLLGATVKSVDIKYPNANRDLLSNSLPPSDTTVTNSVRPVAYFSAEAVCILGRLDFAEASLLHKTLTVVTKSGDSHLVTVPIGIPIKDILQYLDQSVEMGDRVIVGGPMKGTAVYSVDVPVMADTDMLMIQSPRDIIVSNDVSCLNCGACVRSCPVHLEVNNLIRLLDAKMFREAAEKYHLFCCIDCGLCSYVCEARIAVFHHIRLAKQALKGTETYERYAYGP